MSNTINLIIRNIATDCLATGITSTVGNFWVDLAKFNISSSDTYKMTINNIVVSSTADHTTRGLYVTCSLVNNVITDIGTTGATSSDIIYCMNMKLYYDGVGAGVYYRGEFLQPKKFIINGIRPIINITLRDGTSGTADDNATCMIDITLNKISK